jgi:hypothetical protein
MLNVPVFISALAWLVSWFLPVLVGIPGWAAFRLALAPLIPYSDAQAAGWEDSVPQVLSALTNVMFVVLVALWFTKQMFRAGMFVRLALACFLLNLYWPVQAWRSHQLNELLFGYWVWLAAFALLLVVAILNAFEARRTSRTPTAGTPS